MAQTAWDILGMGQPQVPAANTQQPAQTAWDILGMGQPTDVTGGITSAIDTANQAAQAADPSAWDILGMNQTGSTKGSSTGAAAMVPGFGWTTPEPQMTQAQIDKLIADAVANAIAPLNERIGGLNQTIAGLQKPATTTTQPTTTQPTTTTPTVTPAAATVVGALAQNVPTLSQGAKDAISQVLAAVNKPSTSTSTSSAPLAVTSANVKDFIPSLSGSPSVRLTDGTVVPVSTTQYKTLMKGK